MEGGREEGRGGSWPGVKAGNEAFLSAKSSSSPDCLDMLTLYGLKTSSMATIVKEWNSLPGRVGESLFVCYRWLRDLPLALRPSILWGEPAREFVFPYQGFCQSGSRNSFCLQLFFSKTLSDLPQIAAGVGVRGTQQEGGGILSGKSESESKKLGRDEILLDCLTGFPFINSNTVAIGELTSSYWGNHTAWGPFQPPL